MQRGGSKNPDTSLTPAWDTCGSLCFGHWEPWEASQAGREMLQLEEGLPSDATKNQWERGHEPGDQLRDVKIEPGGRNLS